MVNPITVGSFAFLFNCTPVGWTSDSYNDGYDLKTYLLIRCFGGCQTHPGLPVGFLLLRYSVLCTVRPYLCFIAFLYLDLYVFGDDALIS